MSARDYAILWVGAGPKGARGATAGGGNVLLNTAQHHLDGPEHLATSDTTNLDASTTAHGLLPKLSGDSGDALLGDGSWGPIAAAALPWFIVTDPTYGAVGDGTTDDTSAINSAIAALNSATRGVLYFPAGSYKCTSALTTITVQCTILGDGGSGDSGHVYGTPATEILQTSATANLFAVSANGCAIRGVALSNTNGGTPSAGAGISMSGGYFTRISDCTVSRFYDDISISNGAGWSIDDCFIHDPIRYGLRVQGTLSPDSGDQSISGSYFMSENHDGDAAIRYESAGGLKIVNTKINARGTGGGFFVHGIDVAVPNGVTTSLFMVANTSIENVTGDAIHGTTTGTAFWSALVFTGLEVGLYGNNSGRAINLVAASAGQFLDIVLDSYVFITDGTARAAVAITNVDKITFGDGVLSGFNALYTATTSTNIVDNSTGGGAPTTADYLVGTSQGGLSAEIVVGTSPGGELGGTWASPTVDAVHSGSAHVQALDDLTDVSITSASAGDRFRYSGSAWVNSALRWEPHFSYDGTVVLDGNGDPVMVEVS
jgi:hypothetical protein